MVLSANLFFVATWSFVLLLLEITDFDYDLMTKLIS